MSPKRRGGMMEPARTSGEATTCGMDAETERLLNDIFMAYSLPCGVLKGKDGTRPGPQSKLAKAASVPVGAMEVVDAMDDIGWQQLCSDCKLDDDSCLPAARPLFKQVAKGDTLEFTGFVEVLKAIARVRYGEDGAMTRLVYFKLIRFARGSLQVRSQQNTPRVGSQQNTPRVSEKTDLFHSHVEAGASRSQEYFARLYTLHKSLTQDRESMLNGAKELISSFERYRASSPEIHLPGLAQMFSDIHLLPSPLSYAQIRAHYRSATGSQEEDGLNYASFLDALSALAHPAFPDARGDRATDKLLAAICQHLPKPPAHISVAMEEESSDDNEDSQCFSPSQPSLSSVVPKLAAFKIGEAEGLEEALSNLKLEAQKKLERLASEFAAKQIELQKQRDNAVQNLEDELQVELAQNAVRAARKKRSTTRPSTERLNIEEKLAALDRSRACRPSRSIVHDGAADKLEQERAELTRRVLGGNSQKSASCKSD